MMKLVKPKHAYPHLRRVSEFGVPPFITFDMKLDHSLVAMAWLEGGADMPVEQVLYNKAELRKWSRRQWPEAPYQPVEVDGKFDYSPKGIQSYYLTERSAQPSVHPMSFCEAIGSMFAGAERRAQN